MQGQVVSTEDALVAALETTIARARRSPLYAVRLSGVRCESLEAFARLPPTTRADLQRAGVHGTRAVPLSAVCHYGESSGTSGGGMNATWLTAADFARDAEALRLAHPEVFAPGRVILNRFPFMAAPAHLLQLIAQQGGGVAIPAGNINWDVPFPRALELARRTGAQVLGGLPLEPVVLAEIARTRSLDVATDLAVDTLFLGGAPLPPAMVRRLARTWRARVVELYGSTETMLLGTSCPEGTLHLYPELAYCEVVDAAGRPAEEGSLLVTTLGIEGSPLVRFEVGDMVRRLGRCACGSARPGLLVLGRLAEMIAIRDGRLWPHDVLDAAAAAADALDSSVFFVIVLQDRIVVRIEAREERDDPVAAWGQRLPGVAVEIERVRPMDLLDVELLCRSPHVYKPVVASDWRRPGRRILSVSEGMIEWPRPTLAEGWRWLGRVWRTQRRRRSLSRQQSAGVANEVGKGNGQR